MEIDVREGYDNDHIDTIRFGEGSCDTIELPDEQVCNIRLGSPYIDFDDVEYLIKALQKAREIWIDD